MIWLRKQATNFLDSKKDDVTLMDMRPKLNEALSNRGFTGEDFSKMIRTINEERKLEKEAQKAATAQEASKPMESIPEATKQHREPQGKRESNNSGVTVKKSKYTGPSILDMADNKRGK